MMRALTWIHRWLGIPFCLLFAMWFASGIVMHAVPFPALTEAERIAGLAPLDSSWVLRGPGDAVAASGIAGATRLRLLQRSEQRQKLAEALFKGISQYASSLSHVQMARAGAE